MKVDRFLVVGANSFSGSHFVNHLLREGMDVIGVSRSKLPAMPFRPFDWSNGSLEREGQYTFLRCDLNNFEQTGELMELLHERGITHVVNFAAQGMVAESWLYPEDWYQTNVVAQVHFHQLLRSLESLKKYVHVSTPEVYGSTDGWIGESFNFYPSTPYAVSRAACDMHLVSFLKAYKFPVVFTRSANVFGPGQQLYRIIPKTILCARLGERLKLHGGGGSERSFIYIDDVCRATLAVAQDQNNIGESYHISTDKIVSIKSLVELLCAKINVPFDDFVDIEIDRLGKDQGYFLSSQKIRKAYDWADRVELNEGLDQTISWVDENLAELRTLPLEYRHTA